MSDNVQFDEDQVGMPKNASGRPATGSFSSATAAAGKSAPSGMTAWLIRNGIISGESSAKAVLIGIISINFIAAVLIIYFFVLR